MSKSKKFNNNHAAARLVQRYHGKMSIKELETAVKERDYDVVVRQSRTRFLCWTSGVYFILGLRKRAIITVLSERMALEQIRSYA